MNRESLKTGGKVKRRALIAALAIALLALLPAFLLGWLWLTGSASPVDEGLAVADSAVHAPPRLSIYYTCDTSGQIEPCRCSSGQTGGMSRRIGWLKAQPAGPSLLVDAGNVVGGPLEWERFEFEYLLKGYAEAGYQAVNLGRRELTLGASRLAALRDGPVPFVSANVTDDKGNPIFEPYRIVTLEGGSRVGILGVVSASSESPFEAAADVRVTTPSLALERWLPDVQRQSEMIVLLAFLNEDEIQQVAEQFDGIDVIIGGDTFRPTGQPLRFNKSLVGLMTDKGKAIGHMDLTRAPDGSGWDAQGRIVMLDVALTPDEKFEALYEQYKSELAAKDFRPSGDGGVPANHYVGSEACRECHARACEIWDASAHAHALASLKEQNNHYNPRCLPCHVTGYGASGGFVNEVLTASLANVQCEACHGRGGHHIQSRKGEPEPGRDGLIRRIDCTVCHDEVNSPGFEFETYWKKIAHGGGEGT